jgi:hypothetical protein
MLSNDEIFGLEIYDRNRFFTITGKVIEGYSEIQERTVELIRIYNWFLAKTKSDDATYHQPIYVNSSEPRNERQPSDADMVTTNRSSTKGNSLKNRKRNCPHGMKRKTARANRH